MGAGWVRAGSTPGPCALAPEPCSSALRTLRIRAVRRRPALCVAAGVLPECCCCHAAGASFAALNWQSYGEGLYFNIAQVGMKPRCCNATFALA